jgi:hypothetical protein
MELLSLNVPDAGFFTVGEEKPVKAAVARVYQTCKESLHIGGILSEN